MKKENYLFNTPFLSRFSSQNVFLPLCAALTSGLLVSSGVFSAFHSDQMLSFLRLFSGLTGKDHGFFSCLSTLLLNQLIFLILLFLLGMTAFGAAGVPLLLFFRGMALGVGMLSFFSDGSLQGLPVALLCYLPAAVAASLLMLLFGTRALLLSNRLAKAGFSTQQENLSFHFYLKDFLTFLCFAVAVSLAGAFLAVLCAVF